MVAYVIGIILVMITILIIGLILRKKIYDSVDSLEIWKMDIMNRNTAAELARVKGLNLSGETQEKFESWKNHWEFIVTKQLPDIEELLFDAEDAADRYRFPSAKKILRKVDKTLSSIENDIEIMLEELEELIDSEKTSREEIKKLKPMLQTITRDLMQNRNQFGKAETRFKEDIKELEGKFIIYDNLVESGNYIEANELVNNLKMDIDILEDKIEEYPEILAMCADELPAQLHDLSLGIKGMKDDGYQVQHLGLEREIHNYEQRLTDCIKSLEKGAIAEVNDVIVEMTERIKEIYDLLKKEAIAKNYIETQVPYYQESLKELGAHFSETSSEMEILKETYFFEERDMERYLLLEKSITQSKNQLDELSSDLEANDKSHSKLREKLEVGFNQLEEVKQKHNDFKKQIRNLRKDELEAIKKISGIRDQINTLNRKLQKSNLPGVPNFIWDILKKASEKNNHVFMALEEQPLDISKVQQALSESESTVDHAVEQIDMMIDQAYLTELVIQYANRYRSRYPFLAAKLSEAERLFRTYEYELSLEHAAEAIEEIEPGALKKIEANELNQEAL